MSPNTQWLDLDGLNRPKYRRMIHRFGLPGWLWQTHPLMPPRRTAAARQSGHALEAAAACGAAGRFKLGIGSTVSLTSQSRRLRSGRCLAIRANPGILPW